MQNKIQKLIHDHNIAKNRWPTGIKSIDAAHDLERERLKKEYEDYEKNVKETKKTNLLKLKKLRGYL